MRPHGSVAVVHEDPADPLPVDRGDRARRAGRLVVEAYSDRADEYAQVLGSMHAVHSADRSLVESWADGVTGTVLDAGCGPGHWTAHLAGRGHPVVGLDSVPRFVELARAAAPGVDFRVGSFETTGLPGDSIGGVLSWYSLVHHAPDRVAGALAEFRRVLVPGGGLLVGFFAGEALEPFDHAVTTAHRWPVAQMADVLDRAGFTVVDVQQRTDPGVGPPAAGCALRRC